jgi:hypothetical protein
MSFMRLIGTRVSKYKKLLLSVSAILLMGSFAVTRLDVATIFAQTSSFWSIERDGGDDNKLKFYFNDDKAASPLVVDHNNKVGIGLTSPTGNLHVFSGSAQVNVHIDAPTANSAFLNFKSSGATKFSMYRPAGTDDLRFDSNLVGNILNLTNAGNVGIGTTNPGNDKLDVRGRAYASEGWQTSDADYAEWFEKEGTTTERDIIGINLANGKARKYQTGDKFIGIYSSQPAVVGNRLKETEEEMKKNYVLVGLLGQLEVNKAQVTITGRIVQTKDGKEIGVLLSNGKVLIGR